MVENEKSIIQQLTTPGKVRTLELIEVIAIALVLLFRQPGIKTGQFAGHTISIIFCQRHTVIVSDS